MQMYKIIRYYVDPKKENETIKTGMTLDEAKKHCNDPGTHKKGVYFDGFTAED